MKILGVKIDNLTIAETLQKIEVFLRDGQQHYLVTPNPEFLVEAQKDEEFKRILNQADLAVPDGMGLVLAARFLGQPLKQRITGTDLMEEICQRAAQKKWPVFLLGGRQGVAEKARDNLRERYQGLEIKVNSRSDLFDTTFLNPIGFKKVVSKRSDLGSAILFVALGAPKQEKWIVENLKLMPSVKLVMGVGGAFDFMAGRARRAPKFLRAIGLEWLWRLFCQPRRIIRIFKAVVVFPWLVIRNR